MEKMFFSHARGTAIILRFISFALLFASSFSSAAAQSVEGFSWDAPSANADGSTPVDVSGYEILYGTSSGAYSKVVNVGNVLSANILFPVNGTYFVTVRAYDAAGNRSSLGNEISVAVSSGPNDADGDGTVDENDCASADPSKWRSAVFYSDTDADGVRSSTTAQTICYGASAPSGFTTNANGTDNCPNTANAGQADSNSNGIGDACETATSDSDQDGILDGQDNCPTAPNADQLNTDRDNRGDACDTDDDNDSVADHSDCASADAARWRAGAYADTDGDGITDDNELVSSVCYGESLPSGYAAEANGPDNCPERANADQADTDQDGKGDLCDKIRRNSCSLQADGLSVIPLVRGASLQLLDPVALTAVPAPLRISSEAAGLVANYSGGNGPGGFGELEIQSVRTGQGRDRNKLSWKLSSDSGIASSTFGKAGETPLICFGDEDGIADRAVWSAKRFALKRSSNGKTIEISFAKQGTVKDAECADLDGDGKDELLVLRAARKNGRAATLLSVFDLSTKRIVREEPVNKRASATTAFDTDGDGSRELCTIRRADGGSELSCFAGGGEAKMSLPAVQDLMPGAFAEDGTNSEGLAVIGLDGRLYTVTFGGVVSEVKPEFSLSKTRLGRCR